MATRTCPECGAQYVATVRRCIDCDVVLTDEVAPDDGASEGSSAAPMGDGDQVGYELAGWGNQLKVSLEGMLDKAGIARAWEAGALVVAATDEAAVDELIATLEGGEVDDLDPDVVRVALEIEGLDPEGHDELDARLLADAIWHAWDDEGALVVVEDDEERVLEIIDDVLDGDDDGDGSDGLAAQDALSATYVAVDRLVKGPHERKLAAAYVAAAERLAEVGVPFGFAASTWAELVEEAGALARSVRPHAGLAAAAAADADAEDEPVADDEGEEADEAAADGGDGSGEVDGGEVDASDEVDEVDAEDVDDVDDVEERDRTAARALRAKLADLV
ncbi:MAG: hypothetical protein KF703_15055 [Actinobacteria bacterium]|nr:hypothetical protein [Actinomycetota bacterium]